MPGSTLNPLVNAVSATLAAPHNIGLRAELRRSAADRPGAAFWKLAARHLDPAGELGGREISPERVTRWHFVVRCIADLADLHRPGFPLGTAMARAGVSEPRAERLLRSSNGQLQREVQSVLTQLRSSRMPCDAAEIARLVLTDGTAASDAVRYAVSRDYFNTSTHEAT
jgi:CRISPR type I-E-associated protein CasB/Cse2